MATLNLVSRLYHATLRTHSVNGKPSLCAASRNGEEMGCYQSVEVSDVFEFRRTYSHWQCSLGNHCAFLHLLKITKFSLVLVFSKLLRYSRFQGLVTPTGCTIVFPVIVVCKKRA